VSMDTNEIVENILAHHGIKGMKWGVRRQKIGSGLRKVGQKVNRGLEAIGEAMVRNADANFERRATDFGTKVNLHNRAGELMNAHGDLDRINNKSEYIRAAEHGILLKEDHPVTRKYEKEYMDAYVKRIKEAAAETGTNWSGTRELAARRSDEVFGFSVYARDVKHADDPSVLYKVKFVKDDQGRITGFEILDSIAQGAIFVDNYLAHHGVKGQKWGVRKERTRDVTITTKGKKNKAKTKGGQDLPIHSDAIAKLTVKQIKKQSGINALSDKDLEAYARRLDLEQRVKRLESGEKSGASQMIRKMLRANGNQKIREEDSTRVKRGKLALKLAAAAA
jgi:hypothetical protein